MISKMIDEAVNNDLSIDEQVGLLEDIRKQVNYLIQKKIKKIKDNAVYCPFCAQYYKKDKCNIRESIEDREVRIFKALSGDGEVYANKSCRIIYITCPFGHQLKYEKWVN